MSRILYPGLGADPLDTLSPGAAAFGGRPRSPTAAALPDIPPDQQSSMLSDLMESSLGGLAYVGKVFDKPGRAVRGAIDLATGGDAPASELLSFLPFSDALGITQEKNNVQGTDLTDRLGITDPAEKDSLLNMAAGFGAELLTDPLTYVGVGALTRAGKAAEKTGTLAKGLAPKIAAGDASLFGVGLPFQPPLLHLGTGRAAQAVAGGLDAAKAGLAATAPVRAVRAAVDPLVGGAYNRAAQLLNEDVLRPTVRGLERDASEKYVEFLQRADPFIKQDDRGVADVVRLAAEGFLPEAHTRAAAAFGADGPAVVKIGEDLGAAARSFQQAEAAAGLNTRELTDAFAEYLTRSKNHLPRKAGEGWFEYLRRSAQEFSTTHGSQIARDDLFRDVPGGTVRINEWAKDPALRGMTPLQRDAYFRQELTGSPAINPDKAINEKAARLGKWVEGLPAEHVTEGLDFFRPDPFADFLLRGRRSAQARGGAETVFEGIKRYAEPVAQIAARGGDGVPVDELLRKLALDSVDPAGHAVGPERAAALLGVGQNDLKGYAIPSDMAKDVLKLGRAWATPTELGPLAAGWDALSNLFKTWVTTPFAAFHSRNLMSGFFNQWRDDAFSLGANKQAMDVLRGGQLAKPLPGMAGATPQEWTDQLVREAVAGRVAFTRDSGRGADTAVQAGQGLIARSPGPDGGGLLDWAKGFVPEKGKVREQLNPFNVEGVNRDRDVNVFVKQMRAAQGAIDDWVQLGHYISKRQAGFNPEQAALAVKKYHNDYLDLTSTERNVLKRVFPWYSFSRRALPPLLEDLATKPAKVQAALRLTTGVRDPGEFTPGYVAEGASVPIPGAPDGQQRYISSFGLPIEDEALKTLGSFARGDVTRGLQSLLGMAQPQIKVPLEQAFGTQLFTGRRLEDLRALSAVKNTGLLDEENARVLSQVVANSPASRFASSLDKLLDDRKGTVPTAVNLLLGARISDVDAAQQRDLAAKRLLQEQLRGKPGVRVAEDVYVPVDKLPLLDPLDAQLYALYRSASKSAQEVAKARKEKAKNEPAPQ